MQGVTPKYSKAKQKTGKCPAKGEKPGQGFWFCLLFGLGSHLDVLRAYLLLALYSGIIPSAQVIIQGTGDQIRVAHMPG